MASLSPVPLTRANLLSIATSSSASPSASPALLDNDVNSTYVPTISTATLKRRNSRCSLKFEGWSSNDHCHHVSKVHKTLTRQCEYSGGEKEIRISCNEKRLAHRYVGISFNTMHKIVEMKWKLDAAMEAKRYRDNGVKVLKDRVEVSKVVSKQQRRQEQEEVLRRELESMKGASVRA